MEVATASRLPSGEYAISFIEPLPSRAIAPAGRLGWVGSCAKVTGEKRAKSVSRVAVTFIVSSTFL